MAKFQCNVISYVLKRTVDITVIIPTTTIPEAMGFDGVIPTHVISEKYPVLYLLHGMGNNHGNWCSYSNIELYAEERNIAVVMISGENKFYRTVTGGDDFFAFVSKEVPEFITNMFPVSDKPEHTYIAGLSMGGYGSLLHGLSQPERFAAIGSFSGAVQVASEEEWKEQENGPFDLRYLVKKNKEEGTKIPPVYLSCGEEDMLYQMNVDYKDFMMENQIDITWKSVPDYTHEWRFWDQQVEEFLKWIPRTDSFGQDKIRKV